MIEITIHLEADKLADALNILAAAILGTPASKAEGTQFSLQPTRGSEGADPAEVKKTLRTATAKPAAFYPEAEDEAAAGAEAPAPEPAPKTAAAAAMDALSGKKTTLEEVRAAMAAKAAAGKRDKVNALLLDFGATVLTKIDPTRFPALLKAVEAL